MPLLDGVVHADEGTVADDPLAEINKGEWNKPHIVMKYMDITPSGAVPAPPLTGFREFWIESGVSPNKRIYHGIVLPDGTEVPIYDFYV